MSFCSDKNKKKKKLAPFSNNIKEKNSKSMLKVDEDEEFSEDLLAEVFNDVKCSTNDECNNLDSLTIDLDDWIPPVLKAENMKKKLNTIQDQFLRCISTKEEKNNVSVKKQNSSFPNNTSSSAPLNKREMMFTSREFDEDSILKLRFLKRDVPASKIKELVSDAQKVSLYEALKFAGAKNWFTFGVVTEYALLQKSGSARMDVTDLAAEPYIVRFLLFNSAYSDLGKVPVGAIVCILNPKKAKPYNGREAFVVNDFTQILVAGTSRDFGLCSGKKKAGGVCRAVVNLNMCRYCRFHAVSEFKQQRVAKDLKAASSGVGFTVKKTPVAGLWNAKATQAPSLTPAKKNIMQLQKDKDRLAKLDAPSSLNRVDFSSCNSQYKSSKLPHSSDPFLMSSSSLSSSSSSTDGLKRRLSDLHAQRDGSSMNPSKRAKVGNDTTGTGTALSTASTMMSDAKKKAMQFVKENGRIAENSTKMKNKEKESTTAVKPVGITEEFLALMKEKPRDAMLLKDAEALERDKRFERLLCVEEISEKLAATHEVPVRAIRCLVCKKNFHQLPLQCVMNKHGCRVVTGTKRYFQCNGCRGRTTTLERLPTTECSKCGVWSWKRAGVSADRTCNASAQLSIRGMEEKFVGSVVNDPNLSLLVPENLDSAA